MRRDPWQALADPTRRKIIEVLSVGDQTINTIAQQFDISRPAISKQLKILEESTLIEISTTGRQRICSLSLKPLEEIADWIRMYDSFWISKLDKLDRHLNKKKKS